MSDDTSAFLAEASSIQDAIDEYSANVSRVTELRGEASKAIISDAESQGVTRRLDALVQDTNARGREIKRRIEALAAQSGATARDNQIRSQRVGFLKQKFQDAVRNYQDKEYQSRQKARQKLVRQIEIVNPDASSDEVRQIVESGNGDKIFSQALLGSNRLGESTAAYREVQARQQDVQKIEETLTELAQLFNDLATITEKQGETIDVIEGEAAAANKDLEGGHEQVIKARDSAAAARRKRKICAIISALILIIIAIVVAIAVTQVKK